MPRCHCCGIYDCARPKKRHAGIEDDQDDGQKVKIAVHEAGSRSTFFLTLFLPVFIAAGSLAVCLGRRFQSHAAGTHVSVTTRPHVTHSYTFLHRVVTSSSLLPPFSLLAMSVLDFLCDIRFHQSFVLPPNSDTGRPAPLRISYADYGDSRSNAVVLFCGALMGSRFCYSPLDQLAKAYNVRIIHPDRPGIGGSQPVDLDKRIQTWLGWSCASVNCTCQADSCRNGTIAIGPSKHHSRIPRESQWR